MSTMSDAETFIRKYREELGRYESVFRDRVIPAFAGLEEEARTVEEEARQRMSPHFNPEHDDPSQIVETAYFAGVEYYLTTDAVRRGVCNLMIAGLFHLLEQQSQGLATRVLSNPIIQPSRDGGFLQLNKLLNSGFRINIEGFKCWGKLAELNMVANVVKHAGGPSAKKLRDQSPDLFKDPHTNELPYAGLPLRPLLGEGLQLTENHFAIYKRAIENFWDELTAALLSQSCPSAPLPPMRPKQ